MTNDIDLSNVPDPILRLVNPYGDIDNIPNKRVQVDIPEQEYNWLFRGVLVGARGAQREVLSILLKSLIDELRKPEYNLAPHYDTRNESVVATVLSRCSFSPPTGCSGGSNDPGPAKRVRKTVRDSATVSGNSKGTARRGGRGNNKETTRKEGEGVEG